MALLDPMPQATGADVGRPVEQVRIERVVRALGGAFYPRVLHLGCGTGSLTEALAHHSGLLTACDCGPIALHATARALEDCPRVDVVGIGSLDSPPAGEWDLVVCEGLSALDDAGVRRALRKIETSLILGGTLLVVEDSRGFLPGAVLGRASSLGSMLLSRPALARTYSERRPPVELQRFCRV